MDLQGPVTGVSLGATYAIIAVGFTLVYRVSRVLNLAHGAVMMAVGLLCALTLSTWEWTSPVTVLIAAVALGAVGMAVVHLAVIRTFRSRDQVTRLAALVGVLFAAGGIAQSLAGTEAEIIPPLVRGNWRLPLVDATLGKHEFVTLVMALITVAGLAFFLSRTVTGRAMRAVAEDQRGAILAGISVERLLLVTAVIAGALAGLAAVLVVPQTGVNFRSGFDWTVVAVVAAVIGGLRSVWGAVLGGLLVGLVHGVMLSMQPAWFASTQFALLILVLAFRPEGLLGAER